MAGKHNFHESFVEYDAPKGPSDRKFGYTVGGIFAALGILKTLIVGFSVLAGTFLLLGGGLLLGAALKPEALAPLNRAWMKLAEIMFHVVNPVIMFLLYAVCFVPAGLVMKLVGFDPMRRKFDDIAPSYWVKKEKTDLDDPMTYQF